MRGISQERAGPHKVFQDLPRPQDSDMRLLLPLLAAACLIASTYAVHLRRQLPGFPPCADNCLNTPTNLGGCSISDEKCLCNSLAYLETTLACIYAACPASTDQQMSVVGAENLCLSFGATLTTESSIIFAALSTLIPTSVTTANSSSPTSTPASSAPPATSSTGSSRKLSAKYLYLPAIVGPAAFAAIMLIYDLELLSRYFLDVSRSRGFWAIVRTDATKPSKIDSAEGSQIGMSGEAGIETTLSTRTMVELSDN
ncbi:hypothetical protein C8F01DRAFT_1368728 [Mycena amicta]|nr:hypothetical protein C8F01DRAFT_1368728 [Mycena amicta]